MPRKMKDDDQLPVFNIEVEDDNEALTHLSLVTDPATEAETLFFSKQERIETKNMAFTAVKEEQKIVGPAILANKHIYRNDEKGEYFVVFKPDVIKKIVEAYWKNNNNKIINFMHTNRMIDAYIGENWIVQDPVYDKSKYYGYTLTPGSYFTEVKVEDKQYWNNEVKELGAYRFSIEGIMGMQTRNFQKYVDDIIKFSKFDKPLTDNEIKYILEVVK